MLRCIEAGARMGYMPEAHVANTFIRARGFRWGKTKSTARLPRHEVVRSYYPRLSKRDVRYIEFRHNVVLAFAMKRSHQLGRALLYAFRAIAASPVACFLETMKFFGKAKS